MKGIFWNSNWFRDLKKHKFVSDLTKENELSFIAISELGRSDFMSRFLKNLCGGRDFLWHGKTPHGRSRGILLGVDQRMFDLGSIDEREMYIKFQSCNKSEGYKWALAAVYGPAQATHKEKFLAELVRMCSQEKLPLIMGGDYNILRHPYEKNNPNYDAR
jgi:hypothetical protein